MHGKAQNLGEIAEVAHRRGTLTTKRVGVAADHGGFPVEKNLSRSLGAMGYGIKDYDASDFDAADERT